MDQMKREDFIRRASFFTTRNRFNEALSVYTEALEVFPRDIEFWNCKGICLKNLFQSEEALECYIKALEYDSTDATSWNNKGVIFKEREELEKAIECYSTALRFDSSHKSALSNLAIALTDFGTKLKSQNRHKEAIERYKQARQTDPTYSPCLYNLGVILCEIGEFEQAMVMYSEAIKLNPRYVEAFNNMGAICKNIGQLYQAIMYYERALQLNPNFEMSKGNLSVALTDLGTQVKLQGNVKEGIKLYKKALVYNPHHGDAYYNLGVAYGEKYKYDKALVFYQLAINFNPRCAEAYNNLGVIYKDKENLDKAIFYYDKALEVNPSFAQTLNNIGVIYTVVGKMTEAYEFTKRAIDINPNYAEAYNNLGVLYRDQGDIVLAVKAYEKSISIDPNARNALQNRLLALNYLDGIPVKKIYEVSKEWGKLFASTRQQYTSWKVKPNPNRILKIGYIGPDFFAHSVSYFIHAPLKYHDKNKVNVTVYSNVVKEDEKTLMFRKLAPQWKPIFGLNEAVVAKMIYDDEIDILVELTGHTANNRLDVMAWKPAPIQVTWIGYPNTTGLATIDYRISDGLVDPVGTKQPIVEELVRLPDCFLCYTPTSDVPDVSPPPVFDTKFITFGSFNTLAKMGPQVINVWIQVLKAVPNSRLLIKAKSFANAVIQRKYMTKFEMEGISPDRLDLLGLVSMRTDHLKTYSLMDIALDTFPYAGTTTTCESLLMGVPVVVLSKDSNHAHNVGVSLLTVIGMPELVARTEEEYIDIAIKLANDLPRLRNYRERIRRDMLKSPLGNGPRFTNNLEMAYEKMFVNWCEKQKEKN